VKEYFKYYTKKERLRILFVIILTACAAFNTGFAQQNNVTPTRQSSIEAFSKGNYEQAYTDFGQLLLKYPKDPLYKYYSGVCLIMLRRDPEKASTFLQQSVNGASVVRSLPSDALFYLGRAQQMAGKYKEAIESYKLYSNQEGKKEARERGVPGYIQECENKKGMIADMTKEPEAAAIEKTELIRPAEKPVPAEVIQQPVEKVQDTRKELPVKYENILDEALKLQHKADSLSSLAEEQKKGLDKLPEADRAAMKAKIAQNEMLATTFQRSADKKYSDAQIEMNPRRESVQQKTDSIPAVVKSVKEYPVQEEKKTNTSAVYKPDSVQKTVPVVRKPVETYSFFEILPKEAVYPDEKIKIDPTVPAGLVYRIQLAVFRNPVAPAFFKGITPVYGISVVGTDKINYYAGMFRRSADAKKALLDVKAAGFKDAFIVALSDSKAVSADRAAILEQEWGKKPFADLRIHPSVTADTIPPALAFRVEVARSLKPLKEDVLEGMRTMAGNRGLDILYLADGNIAYLIGKFITFESAAEYADLLIRNNYRGAKVVAWLGNKEVPVETAKQLFNNLE
jgi:hypothetical protein